jgi:hypothetical protein
VLAFARDQARNKRGFLRWMAKHQAAVFFPFRYSKGYLTAVFTVLSPLTGLAFIAVHQGLWGVYMGCSFASNHKGWPRFPNWSRF